MTGKIFLVLILSTLVISCSQSTHLHFSTNDAKGLEVGDFLMLDEKTIGHVSDFGLTESGAVIISSELNTEINIPNNSKFKNAMFNKEGQRCIKVTLGNSEIPLNNNDTINLSNSYDKVIDNIKEKLIDKIKDKFNKKD